MEVTQMKHNLCKNCIHFCQHYRLDGLWFVPVRCGHCTHPHGTVRKPDAPACAHYQEHAPAENVIPFTRPHKDE